MMRRCPNAPGFDTGRTFFVALTLAAADRRCRPALARHSGQPPDDARHRGATRNDPRPVHGALRASGRLPQRTRRNAGGHHMVCPAHRRLRTCTSRGAECGAPRPLHLANRCRHGPRGRGRAGRGEGALASLSRRSNRFVHDRNPSWLGAVGCCGCAARRVVRGLAGVPRRLRPGDRWARGCVGRAHTPRAAHKRRLERPPRLPWQSRVAWLLVALFAFMASTYYGLNAWLPDFYVERGWGCRAARQPARGAQSRRYPCVVLRPVAVGSRWGRRAWLIAMAATSVVGILGVVLIPAAAYVWAVALGIASGSMFALVLTLPLDLEENPAELVLWSE